MNFSLRASSNFYHVEAAKPPTENLLLTGLKNQRPEFRATIATAYEVGRDRNPSKERDREDNTHFCVSTLLKSLADM